MASTTKEAVVLFDAIAWYEDETRKEASKGDKVTLPADEFTRLSEMDAVAAPRSSEAKEAKAEAAEELEES